MLVEDMDLDFDDGTAFQNALTVDHDVGYDVDIVGGYDFGMVRLEAELAYKRASTNEFAQTCSSRAAARSTTSRPMATAARFRR